MISFGLVLSLIVLTDITYQKQSQARLIFVQEVFRHGARYPEHVLGIGDEFIREQQLFGDLTNEGKSMHYRLGRKLYKQYWKKLFGGTPDEFKFNDSRFYLKSTPFRRTLGSLQSHLYGLLKSLPPQVISKEQIKFSFPPYPGMETKQNTQYQDMSYVFGEDGNRFHPIAIEIERIPSNSSDGAFMASFDKRYCPNQHKWTLANMKSQKAIKILSTPEFINALRELSLSLGNDEKLVNLQKFYYYYDSLICLQFLGRKVPKLVTVPSETKRTLDAFFAIKINIAFSLNELQLKASTSPFFEESLISINKAIKGQGPKWVIYSAHDVTLFQLLTALRLMSVDCMVQSFFKNVTNPPHCLTKYIEFSSIMIFEVYQYASHNRADPNIYYSQSNGEKKVLRTIKITYNGEYRAIPFCGYLFECEVKAFEEWVNSWTVKNAAEVCGISTQSQFDRLLYFFCVGAGLSFILYMVLAFVINLKRIRGMQTIFGSFFPGIGRGAPKVQKSQ